MVMDIKPLTHMDNEERVAEEYLSSLSDLSYNSKPLINVLTILAEENIDCAPVIVKVVEQHIAKVPTEFKLPILYLIDSIVKNVKNTYVQLFSQCIVNIFCGVFEKVNEKVRERLYALRLTWNEVFPPQKLYALDLKVRRIDQNWPITAKPPKPPQPAIHVNPNFFKGPNPQSDMEEILHAKTRELLELKKRKLELELEATKKHLEEQEKQLTKATESIVPPGDPYLSRQSRTEKLDQKPIPNMFGNDIPSSQISKVKTEKIQNAMTAGNFDQNLRSHAPQMQQHLIPTGGNPSQGNATKPKVNPVNSLLLSTMRDPRLTRHQQQNPIQSGQTIHINSSQASTFDSEGSSKSSMPFHNNSSRNSSSIKRSHQTSRASSNRFSDRPHKNSSTFRKDKDRKRGESKSAASSSSIERPKGSSTNRGKLNPNIINKDDFEIATLSSTLKRTSSSPAASPSKEKEIKQSPKLRKYKREKNIVDNHSPNRSNVKTDVDLRLNSVATVPRVDNVDSDSEKDDIKPFNAAKDFVKIGAKNNVDNEAKEQAKHINCKNEDDVAIKNTSSIDGPSKAKLSSSSNVCDNDNDGKKRLAIITQEDGPLPKKSKAAKLDLLFGTEDVDLRTAIPSQLIAAAHKKTSSFVKTPSQQLTILVNECTDRENFENWDKLKLTPSPANKMSPKKSSALDDVRAKLAKTARSNKVKKFDKSNKELRTKITELNMNDDTQEANDEKIRTIIAQAQELLETDSINQDQYKNLMQTVISINEANKLKEAKRRESLNAASKSNEQDEDNFIDTERLAREAVLKKRIPKITKHQVGIVDVKLSPNTVNDSDCPNEIKNESNEDNIDLKSSSPIMDKRSKLTARDQRDDSVNQYAQASSSQRPRNIREGAQTIDMNFHGNVPHPPMPPPTSHLGLSNVPWQIGSSVPLPPQFDNNLLPMRGSVPPPPQPPNSLSFPFIAAPPLISKPCNSIDNPQEDLVRSITIDGCAKEIRIYDQIAIVFMELDQPREIGFQAGQRAIFIDYQHAITLHFNDDYKSINIGDSPHRMRFGFPSRELYIDDQWYEIYFGGPPVSIPIKNKIHVIKAEGPPPQVNIGPLRRDLVVGKINMIVDALIVVPLFLDAKKQSFFLEDKQHTIQFADNLLTVLLDGKAVNVNYGGLPKSYMLGGKKYFIRFGALPQGIVVGKVVIKDMIYVKTAPPSNEVDINETMNPLINPAEYSMANTSATGGDITSELKTAISATTKPIEAFGTATASNDSAKTSLSSVASNNINIDKLLQNLLSSGIIGSNALVDTKTASVGSLGPTVDLRKTAAAETVQERVIPVDLSKPETIRTRQNIIVSSLFSGLQCSSCGVRFPPEQTIKYSQHLDWHFRRNRRERDSSRKSLSRKWYFDLADWLQYEEFEDAEDREKNFFEVQANELEECHSDAPAPISSNSPTPSCAALPEDVDRACIMCQEKFEQYYNEKFEEWHLRSAVRVNNDLYHPLCYEDYMVSLNPPKIVEPAIPADVEDNAANIVIKIEGDETPVEQNTEMTVDDMDDDDVIVLPNEEPSITEIDDDIIDVNDTCDPTSTSEKIGCENSDAENGANKMNDTTESDVEIQEPYIPFTDLDAYEENKSSDIDNTTPISFMNVKIKEEPKEEDEDDDDGFEDVGTVVITPHDPILINIREETQTPPLDSPSSATILAPELIAETISQKTSETTELIEKTVNDDNDSNDEHLRSQEHNLSIGPAATLPLGSLVNKIKINITKNIVSTNSNSSTLLPKSTTITNNEKSNVNRAVVGQYCDNVVSSIPVLCGGETHSNSSSANLVSSISVIGSYGSQKPAAPRNQTNIMSSPAQHSIPSTNPSPAAETIAFTFKPSLQKVDLKVKKTIESGIETSGLCSIM